jgi:thioredoxin 1
MAKELNLESFKSEVIEKKNAALVDFWATWCPPCRVIGPIVENLSKKYEGKVLVTKVNVDDNQALAGEYNVMNIPTLLFFKDGQIVHKHVGATTEDDLENQIKQHLL